MTKHNHADEESAKPLLSPAELQQQQEALTDHHDDIADFTHNVRTAWDKFGMNTVLIVLLAILSFMIYNWFTGRNDRAMEQAYAELEMSTDPLGKQEVASKYASIPQFEANAYLQSGDLRLREAIFGSTPKSGATEPKMPTDTERQKLLQDAAADYKHVLDIPDHTLLQGTVAQFGIAAILESQGQFGKAAEQYRAIEKDAATQHPYVASLASRKIEDIDRISKTVVFPLPTLKFEPPKSTDIGPVSPFLFPGDPTKSATPTPTPTPAPETPKSEAPKTDAPAVPAPKSEAPKADAPAPAK